MPTEIGSYDAKTKLPEILRRVEAGEAFTITNRGKPVADLTPSRSADKARIASAIANIMQAQKPVMNDATLASLKVAGRK